MVNTPLLTRFFTAWNEVRRVASRGCYVAALPSPAGMASAAGQKIPHEVMELVHVYVQLDSMFQLTGTVDVLPVKKL